MSLYYMPPPPPRPAWPSLSLWVEGMRARFKGISRENRWVLAGLVVAQLMVVAIYMLLVDNLAAVEKKRADLEQQAQERHRCAMMDERLARRECFIALQVRDTQATVLTLAQQ